jgi:endonuclease YncB( thermonuclease family)
MGMKLCREIEPSSVASEQSQLDKSQLDKSQLNDDIKRNLELIDWSVAMLEDVEETDYTNICMFVRIIDIYDGDTFSCVFWDYYMNRWNRKRCRVVGIDTPEMRTRKNIPNRDEEKEKAQEAKDILYSWANKPDRIYIARTEPKRDKYGRLLVDVYRFKIDENSTQKKLEDYELTPEHSLSQYMLKHAPCKEYNGGKK